MKKIIISLFLLFFLSFNQTLSSPKLVKCNDGFYRYGVNPNDYPRFSDITLLSAQQAVPSVTYKKNIPGKFSAYAVIDYQKLIIELMDQSLLKKMYYNSY
jgi:hypothetical protein